MLQQDRRRASTRQSKAHRFTALLFRQGTRLKNHQGVTVLKSLGRDVPDFRSS